MNLPTVFALSTAPGKAGIAIVRVTGSKATMVVEELTGRDCPAPRQSVLRRLFDEAGELLDEALVLYFAAPSSFTGEDVVEFHCHGGRALTAAVLCRLAGFDGVEPAEPGEFTRRAFVNGKLDLAEIEGLSDLLSAETEAQLRQSVAAVGGGVRRRAEAIRGHLLHALALIEATIDWADEDVPEDVVPEVREKLHEAAGEMRVLLSGAEQRERLRAGFEVALVGAPNAGKSSIMNKLADREVALTTPIAGTTRDIIEVQLDLRGLPVTIIDMAGLREGGEQIERLGIQRAQGRAERADLRVFVEAPDAALPDECASLMMPDDIIVSNKCDVASGNHVAVSALSGDGMSKLADAIADRLEDRVPSEPGVAHARQASEMRASLQNVTEAAAVLETVGIEIVAEYLRSALVALERLAGRAAPDDVLEAVFARFCLGK